MIIAIIILAVSLILISFIGGKTIINLIYKNDILKLKFNNLKADNQRLEIALENIELIRKEAKDEHKKIDASDNSVIHSILNNLLSD